MAINVKWTSLALADIESIAQYIAKDSQHYAVIQTERLFERVKILETQPEIGRIVPEIGIKSIRQLVEGKYRIIYRVVSAYRVDILTVHHASRLLADNRLFEE